MQKVCIEKTGKEKLRKGRDKLKSLFSPVSSRIIRVLLDEPQKEGKLIELFRESGASLGYVHKVVESFHEQEYLVKEKKIRINNPGRLLDDWVEGYSFSANKTRSPYSFIKEPVRMGK